MSRPAAGARFLLELERADGASAVYRATVFLPDADYASTATLGEDGSVHLTPTGAPGDHDETLAMFAKLLARGVPKRRDDGLPPWPQRLLRWRGPGRGE
ncbi:MAG: hypothetical protein M4D80_27985 [Myxococcota bacterium]|nr:hypothetical protein [Myxococcota bacterium]